MFVDEDTAKATRKCPREFACLRADASDLCKVLASVDGRGVVAFCNQGGPCVYRGGEADRTVCGCPARIRIHERHGV